MPQPHVVARIGKPHALRGEVTVQLHTDDPQRRLTPGTVLRTEAEPGSGVPRTLTIAQTRVHRGIWLLRFEEIPDRTGAESLRGTRLLLGDEPGEAGDPGADADSDEGWYEEDLVGLSVITPGGEPVGTVSGLEIGAAQDRLVLTLTDGSQALVPFVEQIVPSVDIDSGRVTLDAPAGLLDIAREER
ncbi:ribosome maturation factor RimM [Marihabitans asiaticum]|uniref:Ribosome maturation factor RimM n=1 Tax=Marihabitans asiaticum TaxID=415218 RepID=A0A560W9V6_9MICO|nr:ribosome maturation factor RimM [Marihabitans asiaticum]TWD14330.1 16S rRNA processing protein RimM [Marihabitans asiaticum]